MVRPAFDKRPAQLITVVSARGGSGKTMIATNLAALLASRPGQTAVLADLNLEFPAAALSLNLQPNTSIAELVDLGDTVADDEFDAMLARHPSGMRLVSATLEAGTSERITDAGIRSVLDRLVRLYDFVVVDCRPSFRDLYLDLWESSDCIILACPSDVVSVALTGSLIGAMGAVGVDRESLWLVMNQIVPTQRLTRSQVERNIGVVNTEIPYAGPALHHDEDAGNVYALEHSRQPGARALAALADECARMRSAVSSPVTGGAPQLVAAVAG